MSANDQGQLVSFSPRFHTLTLPQGSIPIPPDSFGELTTLQFLPTQQTLFATSEGVWKITSSEKTPEKLPISVADTHLLFSGDGHIVAIDDTDGQTDVLSSVPELTHVSSSSIPELESAVAPKAASSSDAIFLLSREESRAGRTQSVFRFPLSDDVPPKLMLLEFAPMTGAPHLMLGEHFSQWHNITTLDDSTIAIAADLRGVIVAGNERVSVKSFDEPVVDVRSTPKGVLILTAKGNASTLHLCQYKSEQLTVVTTLKLSHLFTKILR